MLKRMIGSGLAALALVAVLAGCGREDPLAALNAQADALQDALEAHDTGKVMDMLHPQFTAQDGLDRDWAQRTMQGIFLRYQRIGIHVVQRESRLFPGAKDAAEIKGRVVLTGAEGLIPQNADYLAVTSEWRRRDGEWQLFRVQWE